MNHQETEFVVVGWVLLACGVFIVLYMRLTQTLNIGVGRVGRGGGGGGGGKW